MVDENLRRFATDRQWEMYCAVEDHGSQAKAAEVLGVVPSAVSEALKALRTKAARGGYAPEHDLTREVPDGYKVRGVSTLYDRKGEPVLQWVKSAEDRERQRELFDQMVAGLTSELPRVDPRPFEEVTSDYLMTVYPVGDHHLGMYSWSDETGADYDLDIGEQLLMQAFDALVRSGPPSHRAFVPFLGDLMHYDSLEPVTPTSRNQLDSDGRYAKMVWTAVRVCRYAIERVLDKHEEVDVVFEIGNHDLSSSIFLAACFAALYENEPRVRVDTSPSHFHYVEFGKNLIGVHHGHGVKMDKLPLVMASDRPEAWGRTTHRVWYTGHVHQDKVHDAAGCRVESLQVLPPADAWAHQKGYRPTRSMRSIVLHAEHGEVARSTVNPDMLRV